MLSSGEYTLSISVAPSLAFPVAHPEARIASFWGASRDAGARSHEGIDIFAPRGTPVVAAADGYVGSVTVNNLGGNVVFMRPAGKNYSLYYAHLDTQLVKSGERVKSGDTLGTVGNTGNARTTPPHLHFGIYTSGGAINPLPFVERGVKDSKTFTVDSKLFLQPAVLSKSIRMNEENYSRETPVTVVAATNKDYIIVLPDGVQATLPRSSVNQAAGKIATIKQEQYLFEKPDSASPRILQMERDGRVQILGTFDNFVFVLTGDSSIGWAPANAVR